MREPFRDVVAIDSIFPTRDFDPERVRTLSLSIRVVGAVRRVPVERVSKRVIQGHNRLQALRELGYKKVPVVWLNSDPDEWGEPTAAVLPQAERRLQDQHEREADDSEREIENPLDFVAVEKLRVRTLCVGVFDLFHFGHVNLLRGAALLGDHLTVGVQYNVTKRKKQDPSYGFDERVFFVRSLRFVDAVMPYEDVDSLVDTEQPDIFAHGPDQVHDGFQRACKLCQERGARVVEVPRTQGVSSSELRQIMDAHR